MGQEQGINSPMSCKDLPVQLPGRTRVHEHGGISELGYDVRYSE
jgi:hypothetical protein